MSEKPLVQPIQEAIDDLKERVIDAAVDGDYALADRLDEELNDLYERRDLGELYQINF